MGLLDDAIREHLELKRRRGADAGELSRAESEALGPVRRAPDGTPDLTSIPPPPVIEPPSAEPVGLHADYDAEPDWPEETAIIPPASTHSYDPPPPARGYEPPAPPSYEPPPPAAYEPPPPARAYDPPAAPSYEPPPPAAYEPPAPSPYEPPPIPAAPDPGYVMPPALGPQSYDEQPGYDMRRGYDEHPPGFEDLDEEPPVEEPPAPPPREKSRLRLRLRRGSGAAEPPPPPPPSTFDEPETFSHEPPPAAYPSPPAYQPPPPAYPSPPAHEPPPAAYPPPPAPRTPAADEPEGEDLLEETPEFLEETPDHDRLWFEQRPPRDFDFDK
jgi:hypothetical protein